MRKLITDLSDRVDIKSLYKLKPYLDYALVKSLPYAKPSVYFKYQLVDQSYPGLADFKEKYETYNQYKFIKELRDSDELARWITLNEEVSNGALSMNVYYTKDRFDRDNSNKTFETPILKYWKPLLKWVDQQDIFESYARVVVFFNEAGMETPLHRDWEPKDNKDGEEFIWISLSNRKRFYVTDLETGQKEYALAPVIHFNTNDHHGAEPSPFPSWSVRIDGKFKK